MRFKVDDVDAYLAWFESEGNETTWYNASLAEHGIKYAYSQAPPAKGGHIFEFLENLDAVSSDYREEPGNKFPTIRIRDVQVAGSE